MILKRILISLLLVFCTSCQQKKHEDKEFSIAKSEIELNGSKLTLDAFLWRDFMPVSQANGEPLIASLTLIGSTKPQLQKLNK